MQKQPAARPVARRTGMPPSNSRRALGALARRPALCALVLALIALAGAGCRTITGDRQSVRPRSLRDVPAQRLAYRFMPDTAAPPSALKAADSSTERLATVQADFETNRKDDALLRTVVSPDAQPERQRVLALYATGEEQEGLFRIDMYTADGKFLRNLLPQGLSGAFAQTVAWSPDGNYIAFIGRKSPAAQPTPPALVGVPEEPTPPAPTASVAPAFAPTPAFSTEQIYVCNRDGFDLRPMTQRDGLIYFYLAWAPDAHALAALACTESELEARDPSYLRPAGRPRLIELTGEERLLADGLTDALPVWSPDASKVATAFDKDVAIYDALAEKPTAARVPLSEPLHAASVRYDEKTLKKTSNRPVSLNPIVRLEWPQPETLFIETGFERIYTNEPPISRFMRWHMLTLSPQAALLSARQSRIKQGLSG
jgi:WD40-like Beta Propeller Repeat